jgi:cation transport regulator ChaB
MPINGQIGKCADISFRRFTSGKKCYAFKSGAAPSVRRSLPEICEAVLSPNFQQRLAPLPLDPRREEMSGRIAWAAVKRMYHKANGKRVPLGRHDSPAAQV